MLKILCDWIVYSLFKIDATSRLGETINFFIYDSIKILFLLFFMIAVIGFLRSFISLKKAEKWLSGKKYFANVLASMFGAVTPFCSCSSIPIFLSFVRTNIPLGVTFSFLITSPLINEYLVILMLGFFGWKITVAYVLSGLFIGVVSGILIGNMKLEKYIEKDMIGPKDTADSYEINITGFRSRIKFGIDEAVDIVKKLWVWILVGVGIGSFIHNYIPEEAISSIISKTGIFNVPIATIIGVPMYGSCAAIVPIAVVLFKKGVPLGTALAFMMATSALSLPEAIILRRAMKIHLIIIFFSITAISICFMGYFLNFLQTFLVLG
ncbi:MAG: permease [Candidatus Omnitrophica bacterium]|nr:permease [Candidatus Omnitrophota bacterium]MBU1997074.1 permease [Candidatus Omnitrophota bacterium]MBU4334297.1 permease [Candidatus Omnitrophota bacterium]